MRVLIAGDTHGPGEGLDRSTGRAAPGGTRHAINDALKYECEAIVQLGDFWGYHVNSPVPLYWLQGNHEQWHKVDAIAAGEGEWGENQHMIHDYEPFDLGGLKWGGIGRIQDSQTHREMLMNGWWLGEFPRAWMEEDPTFIERLKGCHILLFHDMPHFELGDEDFLCKTTRQIKPCLTLHGHMHKLVRQEVEDIPVIGLPPCDPSFDNSGSYVLDTDKGTLDGPGLYRSVVW